MLFKICYARKALKNFNKIPKQWRKRIFDMLKLLREEPFLGKKLHGKLEGCYSIRAWPYRIIYMVNQGEITIIILNIEHRQGVYK